MRLSWLTMNRGLLCGALLIVGSIRFVPGAIVDWMSVGNLAQDSGQIIAVTTSTTKEKQSADNHLNRVPIPSAEDIKKATSIALRRMQPPKPAPLEPPPKVAAAPVDPVLFAGSLVGVIQDSDPKYCYAVLKWPDNRIQLIARGEHLTEADASPTVTEVNAESVTIEQGERSQTLEMRGSP